MNAGVSASAVAHVDTLLKKCDEVKLSKTGVHHQFIMFRVLLIINELMVVNPLPGWDVVDISSMAESNSKRPNDSHSNDG